MTKLTIEEFLKTNIKKVKREQVPDEYLWMYDERYQKLKTLRKEYRLKNADKIKKQLKEYNLKNKDKLKEYNLKNKDKLKEYKLKNKDKIYEHQKRYREKHKDIINAKRREKRRIRKLSTTGHTTRGNETESQIVSQQLRSV